VVTAVSVVIELAALGGRQRIAPHSVHALWTA
jgi:adenine phosphoribosyltransferase